VSGRVLVVLTLLAAVAAVATCHLRQGEVEPSPAASSADGTAGVTPAENEVDAGAAVARPAFFGAARTPAVDYIHLIYFTPQAAMDPAAALDGPCRAEAAYFGRIAAGESLPDVPPAPVLSARPVTTSTWPITEDDLVDYSVDLSESERAAVLQSERPFVLEVAAPGAAATATLEHTSRLVACVADATHGLVWDDEDPHLFSAAAFRAQRVASWTAGRPVLTRHFTVRTFSGASYLRFDTSGLGKLALPELEVESVPRGLRMQVTHVMNLVAIALWRRGGAIVPGTVDVEVNPPGRDQPAEEIDVTDGARRRGRFVLRRIPPDDDDAPPRLEISFDGWPGRDLHARQEAAITALFGSSYDPLGSVDYEDPAIVAAVGRARAGLPALHRRFDAGLPVGEVLLVKAPFDTPTAGRSEYMWIEVARWQDGRLSGVLASTPSLVPGLENGADVSVAERDVVDWTVRHPDGSEDGGEIKRALDEAAQHSK
jgi:uncharacterized protein YegJ (DUF2314 family)